MTTQNFKAMQEQSLKAWSKTKRPLHKKIKFIGDKPIIEYARNFIIEYKNLGVN